VTNGVMALGFYGVAFVGGWVEQVGALGRIDSVRMVGIAAGLISPPDTMWRLASYSLQPAAVRDILPAIFLSASVPSALMVWWTAVFTVLTLLWAVRSFDRRPL
jgi:hypothetical protein